MSRRLTDYELAEILIRQGKNVDFKVRKPRKQREGPSESQIQISVFRWWHHACGGFGIPENLLMAFPLQGFRTPRNGRRMKDEGCRAGTPDMLLMVPRNGTSGLWIEMKTPTGRVSDEQEQMMSILSKPGGCWCDVCRSTQEAIDIITRYLQP